MPYSRPRNVTNLKLNAGSHHLPQPLAFLANRYNQVTFLFNLPDSSLIQHKPGDHEYFWSLANFEQILQPHPQANLKAASWMQKDDDIWEEDVHMNVVGFNLGTICASNTCFAGSRTYANNPFTGMPIGRGRGVGGCLAFCVNSSCS